MQNVNVIVTNHMCTGCCECISSCSANNICIMMSKEVGHPVPFISESDCTNCGNCIKDCPQAAMLKQNLA